MPSTEDLRSLAGEQEHVPPDWRLRHAEVERTLDLAIELIASLRIDPFQGR